MRSAGFRTSGVALLRQLAKPVVKLMSDFPSLEPGCEGVCDRTQALLLARPQLWIVLSVTVGRGAWWRSMGGAHGYLPVKVNQPVCEVCRD